METDGFGAQPNAIGLETLGGHILDTARDTVLVVQDDGSILYANQAATDLYGYTQKELLRLNISALRTLDAEQVVTLQLEKALTDGILFRTLHNCKDGKLVPVEVSSRKIELGAKRAVVSIIRDISQTVEIEKKLLENEQILQSLNEDLRSTNEELTAGNEELHALNQQLIAAEEELRTHCELLQEKETQISSQNAILSSLHETALVLLNRRDLHELLTMIVTEAAQLARTEHGFIYHLDKNRQVFRRSHGIGIYKNDIGREIAADRGIVGKVRQSGQPMIVNDYQTWRLNNSDSVQFSELQAVIQIPLKSELEVVGTIGLSYCNQWQVFGDEEIFHLSRFAELASIALNNALLLQSYRQELQERLSNEVSMIRSQTTKQTMAQAVPDLMFLINKTGILIDYKPGPDPLLLPPQEFIGKNLAETLPPNLVEPTLQAMSRTFDTSSVQTFEYSMETDGKTYHYEARLVRCNDDEVLAICRNITEHTLVEQQLKHLSLHDALTGLYNRAFFEEEMRRLERQREGHAGLLICDVDGLKIVNDALGHEAGDQLLKCVANILRQSFRGGDVIARIGGDEFVVLLNTDSAKIFEQATRRICQHIDAYNVNSPLPLSLSTGYAVSRHSPPDMTALFKDADNNMYRQKLQQKLNARNAIIQGLIRSLETRDFITEGHAERLSSQMESLARKINLPKRALSDLHLLAQFHDIGKVGIPDNILFKAGKLSPEERKVMQQHCEIGQRIAMSTPALASIANWILRHHEWWNGKGYPLGLKGESIPLECRMLAIIDAFDAMTHVRPYRKIMKPEAALAELRRCSGTQFDPALVEEFADLLRDNSFFAGSPQPAAYDQKTSN